MGDREQLLELRRLDELERRAAEADPTSGMSTTQKVLAGAGKAYGDFGRGIGQLASLTSQATVDEAKARDKPLMDTKSGIAGNILGSAALLAPAMLIPGVNTYAGAALTGALSGALQPVASDDSRLANTAFGGTSGVAGQAIGRGIGRAIRPVASRLSPETAALAQAAEREGIPLSAGDKTGSRPLQITESVMENLPFTSGPQLARREAQQRAFTAAALRRAGIQGDSAGAAALGAQREALGNEMGAIAQRNNLDMNPVVGRFATIVQDAEKRQPQEASARLARTVDQILDQTQGGVMSGTNYQGWREPLRAAAKSGDREASYYAQLRNAMDSEFKGQLSGADSQAFSEASRQYANLKSIMRAMGGAGNLPASGQIAPAQLAAAMQNAMGREGKALGRGDMNELARIGQVFVRDQVPNSGTAQRQLIQSLLTTGGGTLGGGAIGGGTAYATGNDPVKGAAAGAAIGVGGMALPRAAQVLMNSPAGQAYLTNGAIPISQAQRAALVNAMRTLTMSATPALLPANE